MSTWGVDAPYSNEIWSVIPRLSAMRSNCSMVGLSFPQLILFRYCLVQPNLRANSASLMFFLANAFFKSIFVSFFISLWARHSQSKARKKRILPQSLGVSSQIKLLYCCCDYFMVQKYMIHPNFATFTLSETCYLFIIHTQSLACHHFFSFHVILLHKNTEEQCVNSCQSQLWSWIFTHCSWLCVSTLPW